MNEKPNQPTEAEIFQNRLAWAASLKGGRRSADGQKNKTKCSGWRYRNDMKKPFILFMIATVLLLPVFAGDAPLKLTLPKASTYDSQVTTFGELLFSTNSPIPKSGVLVIPITVTNKLQTLSLVAVSRDGKDSDYRVKFNREDDGTNTTFKFTASDNLPVSGTVTFLVWRLDDKPNN